MGLRYNATSMAPFGLLLGVTMDVLQACMFLKHMPGMSTPYDELPSFTCPAPLPDWSRDLTQSLKDSAAPTKSFHLT